MSLASLLTKIADVVLSKSGQTILKGLGIGIVSTTISLTLITKYIDYAQQSYNALGDVIGLLGLAGFDVGLSIVFSALVIKMTLRSKNLSFRKGT